MRILLVAQHPVDGYHTGPNNEVSVMFPMMGGVFDTYTAELLRRADVHLVGRISFELFQSFWPEVAEHPEAEEWTPEQRELSQAGQSVKAIVVSDRLSGTWPDIRIIRRADAHQQIAELKRQPGKDILITGSRTLWNDLLAADLGDEIHLMIGNLLLARLCTFPTQEQAVKDNHSRVERGTKTTSGLVGDVGKVPWPHRWRLTKASTSENVAASLCYQAA